MSRGILNMFTRLRESGWGVGFVGRQSHPAMCPIDSGGQLNCLQKTGVALKDLSAHSFHRFVSSKQALPFTISLLGPYTTCGLLFSSQVSQSRAGLRGDDFFGCRPICLSKYRPAGDPKKQGRAQCGFTVDTTTAEHRSGSFFQ